MKAAYDLDHGRHAETLARGFSDEQVRLIAWADRELHVFANLGIAITGRSLYYRAIGDDVLPESWIDVEYNLKHGLPARTKNTQKNYKRLLDLVGRARLAGELDWTHLKDNLRGVEVVSHWDSPQSIMNAVARSYKIDKWATQPHRVEVWAEKDAVEGALASVCPRLDVPYFVCRGYPSLTGLWDSAQRMESYVQAGQRPVILYLGDHDPSGIDIPRNVVAMLNTFLGDEDAVTLERLALNMDQVLEHNLPPNPAKTTDARYKTYVETYGVEDSWELDALLGVDPMLLIDLIEQGVSAWRDDDAFEALEQQEEEETELLELARDRWPEVVSLLRGLEG